MVVLLKYQVLHVLVVVLAIKADAIEGIPYVTVQTSSGPVMGITRRALSGRFVDTFLGIPFAKPPIGHLRFKPPEPISDWSEGFNATEWPATCIQKPIPFGNLIPGFSKWVPRTATSEDCLKLNIWKPALSNQSLAVMVWIYGGGFTRGSTSVDLYDGGTLADEGNVIVISINYRVSSLGFLFLDHPDVPGNAGLMDQRLALQWIQQNIVHFGGDSQKITIFGQSAGAASVGFHLLSPLSRSLFTRAILQSGGPTAQWTYSTKEKALEISLRLVESLECIRRGENVTLEVVQCLQTADAQELMANDPQDGYGDVFIFKPVIDGTFVTHDPKVSLAEKDFKQTDVMIGTVKNEGSMFLLAPLPFYFTFYGTPRITRKEFTESVKVITGYEGLSEKAISLQYTDWLDPENVIKNAAAVEKIFGDCYFTCSVNEVAESFSMAGNKVFKYFFTHRSSRSPWPHWMGTVHGEEIFYIFGVPLDPATGYNRDEIEFSRQVIKYWTNFAKFGDPNSCAGDCSNMILWPPYDSASKDYFVLAPNSSTVGRGLRQRECVMWDRFLPELNHV